MCCLQSVLREHSHVIIGSNLMRKWNIHESRVILKTKGLKHAVRGVDWHLIKRNTAHE